MKIKALKSFSGTVTMTMNEIKEVDDKIAENLIAVKYAAAVTAEADRDKSDNHKAKNSVKKKSDKDEA